MQRLPTRLLNKLLLTVACSMLSFLIVTAQTHTARGAGKSKLHRRSIYPSSMSQTEEGAAVDQLEIPTSSTPGVVICHTGYTLSYNEKHEQANWVAYKLKKDETVSTVSRTNDFLTDPYVRSGSADNHDYDGYGYDRGHLAPAGDFGWSPAAMTESFYYSNVSPQLPAFNRGVWKRLEELVRFWATAYDSVYIVTGPVLTPGLPFIGPHHVSVPAYYYKAVLRVGARPAAIGFLLPNQPSAATLKSFAVSIKQLEATTGINFFAALPDAVEERAESTLTTADWKWTRNLSNMVVSPQKVVTSQPVVSNANQQTAVVKAPSTATVTVRCSAINKSGKRCSRMTTNASGRCWQH